MEFLALETLRMNCSFGLALVTTVKQQCVCAFLFMEWFVRYCFSW